MVYSLKPRKKSILERIVNLSAVAWLIIFTSVVSVAFFILVGFECGLDADAANNCYFLDIFALKPSNILAGQDLWTLVTHMFIHGGPGHLLINMFVLFSLGGLCERIIGRRRFFIFYLLSGIFAGLLTAILAGFFGFGFWTRVLGASDVYMVGASGAIFAIAGLFVVLLPRLRFGIIFFPFFSFPGYIMIPVVLFGFWILSIIFDWPVGNLAHFGGFLAGMGFGFYLRRKYRRKVKMLQRMFR